MTKQELIERYRDINTDYEWWGDTYHNFDEDHDYLDITPGSFEFSGFWSQGDGASFEGRIVESVFVHFCFMAGINLDKYPQLLAMSAHGGWPHVTYRRHSGRYTHSNTVAAELVYDEWFCDLLWDARGDKATEIEEIIAEAKDKALADEIEVLERRVEEHLRDKMNELYRLLEAEYAYLTSDEVVWESIVVNALNEEEEDA